MRVIKVIGSLFVVLAIVYFIGPRYPMTPIDCVPNITDVSLETIERNIIKREKAEPHLKNENEAKVVWYDDKVKTKKVFLYIHGFSASPMEASHLMHNLSEEYKANLIFARLPGHGVQVEDPLLNITAKDYVDYGKSMIDYADKLGEELIIVSTSTGGTLSAYLASCDPRIDAMVMLSPNFGLADKTFDYLDGPWGEFLINKAFNGNIRSWNPPNNTIDSFWTTRYRVEGLIVLDQLVSNMIIKKVIKEIKTPFYIGYYYKNDKQKDEIIDIEKIQFFADQVSTPEDQIKVSVFPNAGAHVIGSPFWNPNYLDVQKDIISFLDRIFF